MELPDADDHAKAPLRKCRKIRRRKDRQAAAGLASRRAVHWLDQTVPWITIGSWWSWLRFVMLFVMMLLLLWMLYRLTVSKDRRSRQFPGAFFAALGMSALSIAFSWLMGSSQSYPIVYGSLASVIILLLWFNSLGFLMTLGCVFNEALERTRKPDAVPAPEEDLLPPEGEDSDALPEAEPEETEAQENDPA